MLALSRIEGESLVEKTVGFSVFGTNDETDLLGSRRRARVRPVGFSVFGGGHEADRHESDPS
jgi:hypothetical protein